MTGQVEVLAPGARVRVAVLSPDPGVGTVVAVASGAYVVRLDAWANGRGEVCRPERLVEVPSTDVRQLPA